METTNLQPGIWILQRGIIMTTYCLFHSQDWDGYASAAVIRRAKDSVCEDERSNQLFL